MTYRRLPPPSHDPTERTDLTVLDELSPQDEVMIGRAVYYVTQLKTDERGMRYLVLTPRDTAG